MKPILTQAAMILALSAPAFADSDGGDPAKGESDFKKCKSCHAVVDDSGEVIVKGGKVGPNLYGVVGRTAGALEGFKYSASLVAAGEAGLVWTDESLAEYVMDPKGYLKAYLSDDSAKSKMTFKLKTPADVIAWLASVAPPPMPMEGMDDEMGEEMDEMGEEMDDESEGEGASD